MEEWWPKTDWRLKTWMTKNYWELWQLTGNDGLWVGIIDNYWEWWQITENYGKWLKKTSKDREWWQRQVTRNICEWLVMTAKDSERQQMTRNDVAGLKMIQQAWNSALVYTRGCYHGGPTTRLLEYTWKLCGIHKPNSYSNCRRLQYWC